MIAKSDMVILGIASAALLLGVGRWYGNTQSVDAVTIPASARSQPSTTGENSQFDNFIHVASSTESRSGADNPEGKTRVIKPDAPVKELVLDDAEESRQYGLHTVQSGEYLGLIADRYDTSVSQLQSLNDIDGTTIRVGQELRYPQNVR